MEHPGYPLPGPGGERLTKGGHVSIENGSQSLGSVLVGFRIYFEEIQNGTIVIVSF